MSGNERAQLRAAVRDLSDEDGEVRQYAAGLIWKILREQDEDDPVAKNVITALATALADEDSDVRLYSAYALGCVGDVFAAAAAVPALAVALGDPNTDVADVAGYTLAAVGRHRPFRIPFRTTEPRTEIHRE